MALLVEVYRGEKVEKDKEEKSRAEEKMKKEKFSEMREKNSREDSQKRGDFPELSHWQSPSNIIWCTWSCDERGKNKQICLFNITRWDSLGLLVFKNIIALIIEQRWLCSSRSKDILPPVLIQCRQHRWSTQPLSVLRTAAKDAQGDLYKQFVICFKFWYVFTQ